MSSIAELKKDLELVTEHLRIAKENLEYLQDQEDEEFVIVDAEDEEFEFIKKTCITEPFWGKNVNR